MSTVVLPQESPMRLSIALSFLVHACAAASLFYFARESHHVAAAPTYRVNLVAAPPGERHIGVVSPAPPPVKTATPAPLVRERPTTSKLKIPPPKAVKSAPSPKLATPNATTVSTPAQATPAGGGPEGGHGADVANVKVDGIQFPFPSYLNNITRQIALNFKPTARGALTAEVAFLVRRDGSLAGLRLTRRSSVYSFDQDALAAVEIASKAFGALPAGFSDDVLPVIFSFDPRLIR